jgi:hypothetical protein
VHLAGLLLVLTACHGAPTPADGEPALPANGEPPLPQDCPRACRPDDLDCAQFPYEQLPARCRDICYLGACCELVNGAWHPQAFDCAPPVDAGVDPPPDGAPDA